MKIRFCILGPASVGPRIAILFVLASAFSLQLNAQTNSAWTGGTGNWSNASDWTNGVPNGNYNALISNGGPVSTVNLDINSTIANLGLDTGNTLNILPANTLTFQSASGSTINGGGTINLASGGGITIGAGNSLSAVNPTGGSSASFNMGGPGSFINGATGTESFTAVTVNGSGTISNLQANIASLTASGGTLTVNPNSGGLTVGNFLSVNSGSTLQITGPFNNYNSGSLGNVGAIDLQGTLQFNNANITSLFTNLTLDGPGARIVNQFGQNALVNLNTISGVGAGSGLTLMNGAALSLPSGLTAFNGPQVLSGSTLNVTDLSFVGATGLQINNATVNVSGNVNAIAQQGPAGSAQGALATVANGGSLNVQGGYTNYAVPNGGVELQISPGARVSVAGDFMNTSTASNTAKGPVSQSLTEVGGNMTVGGNLTNSGYATLGVGGTLSVAKDLNNTTMTSNPYLPSPSVDVGGNLTVGGSLNSSGDITLDNSASITTKGGFTQTTQYGFTLMNGTLTAGGTGVNIAGGAFYGAGTVNGNFTNAALLAPGNPLTTAPTGTLTINGNFTQTGTGAGRPRLITRTHALASSRGFGPGPRAKRCAICRFPPKGNSVSQIPASASRNAKEMKAQNEDHTCDCCERCSRRRGSRRRLLVLDDQSRRLFHHAVPSRSSR